MLLRLYKKCIMLRQPQNVRFANLYFTRTMTVKDFNMLKHKGNVSRPSKYDVGAPACPYLPGTQPPPTRTLARLQ